MVGDDARQFLHLLVSAVLIVGVSVSGNLLTESLTGKQGPASISCWIFVAIVVAMSYLKWQSRATEESPEAIKERVFQLKSELRSQVHSRSYGARSKLIEAPLNQLDLDVTPRVGWVRDPRLVEPEPLFGKFRGNIVSGFESSERRLLIVGEPGSGKTMAAYRLIEYLDKTDAVAGRIPLLVNLSAWEAQGTFEAFLVDYLCSSGGYQVRQRAVARAFINSRRYALILDGLDEIPAALRADFSQRFDEFVRGLQEEVAVVVTCSTQEYRELRVAYPTGLGLVQAVEMLRLGNDQLDRAVSELTKFDQGWEALLSQGHLMASRRARRLLSSPLFLNLAVAGRLRPSQLLSCKKEQELQALVLDGYLERAVARQGRYAPADARRYLAWIARFLDGVTASPFGLKTSDPTIFGLANLTPSEPPKLYRMLEALALGLVLGIAWTVDFWPREVLGDGQTSGWSAWQNRALEFLTAVGVVGGSVAALVAGMVRGALWGLVTGCVWGGLAGLLLMLLGQINLEVYSGMLVLGLMWGLAGEAAGLLTVRINRDRSAVSSQLAFDWPPTKRQRRVYLQTVVTVAIAGLGFGLIAGLYGGLQWGSWQTPFVSLLGGLVVGLVVGLVRLLEPRAVLITNRTPKEALSRSLVAASIWGLGLGLMIGLGIWQILGPKVGWAAGLVGGLAAGLERGGWFLLLQRVAHRRLARAGNLPPRPENLLEWGIETQVLRRVGSGVRFRHRLIQQHLANASEGQQAESLDGTTAAHEPRRNN